MPLQDVSDDQLMINWLRQSGHGHLIEDHVHRGQNKLSSSPFVVPNAINPPSGTTASPPSNYPEQTANSISSPAMAIFSGGFNTNPSQMNTGNQSAPFVRTDLNQSSAFGATNASPPPMISAGAEFNTINTNQQASPVQFSSSPTPFLTPNINDQQLDINIEVGSC
jgi:hypothetical protein